MRSVVLKCIICVWQASQWEQTEAALFIMQAVARNILPEESEVRGLFCSCSIILFNSEVR